MESRLGTAMTITINPQIEARFRERASFEGISPDAYIERLIVADQSAFGEIEDMAMQGLNSGEPITPGPGYWEDKHLGLELRLKSINTR